MANILVFLYVVIEGKFSSYGLYEFYSTLSFEGYALLWLIGMGEFLVFIGIHDHVLTRIPKPLRSINPKMAWLMLVPLFNMVWTLYMIEYTTRSLKGYYAYEEQEAGAKPVGHQTPLWTGRTQGLIWAVSGVALSLTTCLIGPFFYFNPYIWVFLSFGCFALLVVYLARILKLASRVDPYAC